MKRTIMVLILAALFGAVPALYAEGSTGGWCGFGEAMRAFLETRRPSDPGPEFVYTENFVVHFDTTGERATTRAYAESVAVYAEETWRVQVDSLGRTPPPPDRGEGGDDRYDIYIIGESTFLTFLGYCSAEYAYPDEAHWRQTSSCILLRHDIENWDVLRDIVTQEFNVALHLATRRGQDE